MLEGLQATVDDEELKEFSEAPDSLIYCSPEGTVTATAAISEFRSDAA